MRASFYSTISRLAGAVAVLWLCGTGAAWAGGGSGDLVSLNNALGDLCTVTLPMFGVNLPFCPQAPTTTQGVLQLAAWSVVPPEMFRATNAIPLGSAVDAGNPSIALTYNFGTTPPPITTFPVPATAGPGKVSLSNLLPNLKPLAFISAAQTHQKTATAAQLYNGDADTFVYAVASGLLDHGQQPDTLFLLYEDLSRDNQAFNNGQTVADVSLPLTVLNGAVLKNGSPNPNSGIERPVITKLEVKSCANGPASCFMATATGDFLGIGTQQTLGPASCGAPLMALIGVNCAVVFAPSPISTHPHAFIEVAVPLLVTAATDPLYIPFNPYANVAGPFTGDIPGFPAGSSILGSSGSIGIAPGAVPLYSTTTPALPLPPTFALCASLPDNSNGPGAHIWPAVAAYYAMSTAGETFLSAAFPTFTTSVCPF
jgi:hypothetical protein